MPVSRRSQNEYTRQRKKNRQDRTSATIGLHNRPSQPSNSPSPTPRHETNTQDRSQALDLRDRSLSITLTCTHLALLIPWSYACPTLEAAFPFLVTLKQVPVTVWDPSYTLPNWLGICHHAHSSDCLAPKTVLKWDCRRSRGILGAGCVGDIG